MKAETLLNLQAPRAKPQAGLQPARQPEGCILPQRQLHRNVCELRGVQRARSREERPPTLREQTLVTKEILAVPVYPYRGAAQNPGSGPQCCQKAPLCCSQTTHMHMSMIRHFLPGYGPPSSPLCYLLRKGESPSSL